MAGRIASIACGLIGLVMVCCFAGGCARREAVDAFADQPPRYSSALLFEQEPGYPRATDVGRSDWPSAPGRIEGGEFDVYGETINDYQGGWQGGPGYGWGSFNVYNRRFVGYRAGTKYR